jgi:hypothetical protein
VALAAKTILAAGVAAASFPLRGRSSRRPEHSLVGLTGTCGRVVGRDYALPGPALARRIEGSTHRGPATGFQDSLDPSVSAAVSNPLMSSRNAPSRNTSTKTCSAKSVSSLAHEGNHPAGFALGWSLPRQPPGWH